MGLGQFGQGLLVLLASLSHVCNKQPMTTYNWVLLVAVSFVWGIAVGAWIASCRNSIRLRSVTPKEYERWLGR